MFYMKKGNKEWRRKAKFSCLECMMKKMMEMDVTWKGQFPKNKVKTNNERSCVRGGERKETIVSDRRYKKEQWGKIVKIFAITFQSFSIIESSSVSVCPLSIHQYTAPRRSPIINPLASFRNTKLSITIFFKNPGESNEWFDGNCEE